ncbi:MAG: RPA12/RPB9/RPC11 RNA polymerase family protein [Candidatus Poseidoniales archaeon]|mgnify:FL=1
MFCPICGALSFPDSKNNIKCPDYKCGYEGPLSGPDGKGGKFIDPMSGEEIDLTNATAKSATKSLKHLTEVVEEEVARGTLRVGDYICPNCEENRVYVWMQQTRSSDEPETKMCTCESCNKKWREYQ